MRPQSDPAAVATLAARWEGRPLHALVCAAGGSHHSEFAALTDEDWLRDYELNVLGTVRMAHALLPALRRGAADGAACVLLLGAVSARQPTLQQAVSNTHKAGCSGVCSRGAPKVGGRNSPEPPSFF